MSVSRLSAARREARVPYRPPTDPDAPLDPIQAALVEALTEVLVPKIRAELLAAEAAARARRTATDEQEPGPVAREAGRQRPT